MSYIYNNTCYIAYSPLLLRDLPWSNSYPPITGTVILLLAFFNTKNCQECRRQYKLEFFIFLVSILLILIIYSVI